jgi:hypothetical protein
MGLGGWARLWWCMERSSADWDHGLRERLRRSPIPPTMREWEMGVEGEAVEGELGAVAEKSREAGVRVEWRSRTDLQRNDGHHNISLEKRE